MKKGTAIRLARNPPLAALFLLAFCARALIPSGYMPGPGGFVICHGFLPAPGAGAHAMAHDMSGMGMHGVHEAAGDEPHAGGHPLPKPETGHDGSTVCPFAAAATTMAGGHGFAVPDVVHRVAARIDLPLRPCVPRATIVATRLPRGPPAVPERRFGLT